MENKGTQFSEAVAGRKTPLPPWSQVETRDRAKPSWSILEGMQADESDGKSRALVTKDSDAEVFSPQSQGEAAFPGTGEKRDFPGTRRVRSGERRGGWREGHGLP